MIRDSSWLLSSPSYGAKAKPNGHIDVERGVPHVHPKNSLFYHPFIDECVGNWRVNFSGVILAHKASAHFFKRFTSRLLKLSFSLSLCTYYLGWMSCLISFECCQSSCQEHGTSEHYQKNLAHSRIRTTNSARPPDYKPTVITTRPQLAWYGMELNVCENYKYWIYK